MDNHPIRIIMLHIVNVRNCFLTSMTTPSDTLRTVELIWRCRFPVEVWQEQLSQDQRISVGR